MGWTVVEGWNMEMLAISESLKTAVIKKKKKKEPLRFCAAYPELDKWFIA